MDIRRSGSAPTRAASNDWFTGTVYQDVLNQAEAPGTLRVAHVLFTPGARTNWHTHPLGQTLFVTSGLGMTQSWGGPIQEIRPGDVVWIPAGEKHWHGAAPDNVMSHIAMQEAKDGEISDWLEPVTETQYTGGK